MLAPQPSLQNRKPQKMAAIKTTNAPEKPRAALAKRPKTQVRNEDARLPEKPGPGPQSNKGSRPRPAIQLRDKRSNRQISRLAAPHRSPGPILLSARRRNARPNSHCR